MFYVGQITKNKRGDKIKILSFPENYPGYMLVKNYSRKGIDSIVFYPISGKWFPERNPNGSEADIIDNVRLLCVGGDFETQICQTL